MKPLVHAMQEEGKSLVIAPEGTRAPTRKLGAFKKGGFHVAIQSGIPIVPVVIHNSGDISPKGDRIFRSGTVQVDVLPALDTTSWSIQTIDEHIAAVRNLFLHTLGQPELTVAETTALRRDTPDDLKPEVRGQHKKASQPQSAAESSENSVNLRGRARGRRANAKRAPSTNPQNGVDHEAPATRH